jgi:hypothetical protein
MAPLCHTCAVEHATDKLGIQCSKRGLKYPQNECAHYKPTREKRLEDALRKVVNELDGIKLSSSDTVALLSAHDSLRQAQELLGK